MAWIPIAAWIAAAVIALVVLGFCAYEISWKAKRLQRDLQALQGLGTDLGALQGRLSVVQDRIGALPLPTGKG